MSDSSSLLIWYGQMMERFSRERDWDAIVRALNITGATEAEKTFLEYSGFSVSAVYQIFVILAERGHQ